MVIYLGGWGLGHLVTAYHSGQLICSSIQPFVKHFLTPTIFRFHARLLWGRQISFRTSQSKEKVRLVTKNYKSRHNRITGGLITRGKLRGTTL